jgi:hypothetical protein
MEVDPRILEKRTPEVFNVLVKIGSIYANFVV